MSETRTIHDPFLGKDVEISNRLVDRLRGKYANGPTTASGEPEFGWRQFQTPPIQHEAANEIERLGLEILNYQITLGAARKHLKPFASRAGYGKGVLADAASAAAEFLNKVGWGEQESDPAGGKPGTPLET